MEQLSASPQNGGERPWHGQLLPPSRKRKEMNPAPDYWPSASSHSQFGEPGDKSLSVDDTDHLFNDIDIGHFNGGRGWHRRRLGENEEVTPKILKTGRPLADSNLDCPEHPLAVAVRSSRPLGWNASKYRSVQANAQWPKGFRLTRHEPYQSFVTRPVRAS
jgi:hypothetical protein